MNADLENDIYKEDVEFENDQAVEFSEKDRLPFPKQEDFTIYSTEISVLQAPNIKMVQEGIFSLWRRYVRLHRLQILRFCQERDLSRIITLTLKNKLLEPQIKQREVTLQKCYVGFIALDDFRQLHFQLVNNREFIDFIHVMQAYNKHYTAVNYLRMIRGIYNQCAVLEEMTHFKRVRGPIPKFEKPSAASFIQLQYKRYKNHATEQQKQIKVLSSMNAEDLFEMLKTKVSKSDRPLKEIFEIFDVNKDGHIVFEEFVQAFRDSQIAVPQEVLKTVFKYFDSNNNGSIQYMEFLSKIEIKTVSNESLLTVQLKVENTLEQLRRLLQKQFRSFEDMFNSLKCTDRLKIKQSEFVGFVTQYTQRFSKIQLDQLFHYLDSKNKNYLNIEDFSMIYLNKAPQELRQEAQEAKVQEQRAMTKMKNEIEDARYLYHYIQAENMETFIQQRDNQLLDLLKPQAGPSAPLSASSRKEIDQRVGIYKNSLLKLEIMIQQFSNRVMTKMAESGLSLKQFFTQFTQRFPEKFLEAKEFLLMLNVIFNQVTDTSLAKAVFKVFCNYYVERVSYEKFSEIIKLGQQISPIQLRLKSQFGQFVEKLKPQLLEEFQKRALMSIDLKSVTLRETFEILDKHNLKLEMFEVQRLVDQQIVQLKDRRYLVDYGRLLDQLFPEVYLIEQVILRRFGYIILQLWKKHKERYFDLKRTGKFKKGKSTRTAKKKPLGTKRTLKEKMSEQLPVQTQQNEYSKLKSGDNYNFAKTIILECVEGAVYYAETQIFTQSKQQDFQRRPTLKDVIIASPFQQVELPNLLGSMSFDYLTQRVYLPDKQSLLYTQDITANRLLSNINIGTRIPFNKSFVVDCIIFDHKMFLLKSNWQLQMWSMTQKSDRHEMAIDLREGMNNATQSARHLYENDELLLVLSSQRTHAHLISSKSLHIIKTVNLNMCVDFHFKSMAAAMERTCRQIIFETNQRFPLKLEMSLPEMEAQEIKRHESINFLNLFKDVRVQKGKLLHYFAKFSQERDLLRAYLDEIADEEGYISQLQFEELFKDHQFQNHNIYVALNIIKTEKPNLKQLFSTYDGSGKNQLSQQQLSEMLSSLPIRPKDVQLFANRYPNGISYQQFSKLVESPLSYDELLYRCNCNNIDLQDLFKQHDIYNVGLLDRNQFTSVLESLPFGLSSSDIEYLAEHQVYDSESGRIKYREKQLENKQRIHCMQYINDLDLLIFSVDYPKRGTIFVVSDKIIAVMEGHTSPPMLLYCKQSGCLLSTAGNDLYIWTLYRDLTLKYDINPPWHLSPSIHQKSISQITSISYLPINQLIVIANQEGISFYDPVAVQQQTQKIQVRLKPGYYQDIEESAQNQKVPLVHSVELTKPVSLSHGLIQTPFQDEEGSTLLTLEYLLVMSEMPMGQDSKNVMNIIRLFLVHRETLEIPSTQMDIQVPVQIQQQIEKELLTLLEQALRSKRARGVIGIEKELNKETLKLHTKRNLIRLSKQLIFQKDVDVCQAEIINEIMHSCKFNGGLNMSFVYNLLRSTQCLNPHNISFEEFRHIVLYSVEYQPPTLKRNQIEIKLQNLIREGQLDLPLEFELQKAMKIANDRLLMKHQFKKLLMKVKAYSNEKDLMEFVVNDCVSLRSLLDRFANDKLIYKLRMIARPDQIVKELQKLGIPKTFLGRLSLTDKEGDGILTKAQFMSAVTEHQALYSEFFDLYSEIINGQPHLKISAVTQRLLSMEENLQYRQMLQILAKVKNALVYRNLGIAYLFREPDMPYHDFCDAVFELKILSQKEVHQLADCLALEQNKTIPFVAFQHYVNKLHVNEQFLLVTDYEQLLKVGNEILKQREHIRPKFEDRTCAAWEIKGFLNNLDFEAVDQYLIKVLNLQPLTYDQLIDRTVGFLNKLSFEHSEQVNKSGLKQIFLVQEGVQRYKSLLSVAESAKASGQLQKLYDQCLQFDADKNSFLELPVFANIFAYNLALPSEALVNFQFEWNQLTGEQSINYVRFFKEYCHFELTSAAEPIQTNLNAIFHLIAHQIKGNGLNLGFVLKRFYNYDNHDFMTIPQLTAFLQQIDLQMKPQQIQEIQEFLGTEISHSKFQEIIAQAGLDVAIIFDPQIWLLASQQISLSSLNKLGSWKGSGVLKAPDFKRQFSQYDESLQILRCACVGSRISQTDAQQLIKQIRLNQADLSQFYVNVQHFAEAIPLMIQHKIREKPVTNLEVRAHQVLEASDDEVGILCHKLNKSLKAIKTTSLRVALCQGLIINSDGNMSRTEFKKLLDSFPYKWTMKEKHLLYQKFKEPINFKDFITLIDESFQLDHSILLTKLFMGCLRKQITLVQLFQSAQRTEISDSECCRILEEFMSPFEANYFTFHIINSSKINEQTFLESIRITRFNDRALLLQSGLQVLQESVLEVLQEVDDQQEQTVAQIQFTLQKVGINLSQQVVFCLLNNFMFDERNHNAMYEQKVARYRTKEFLKYLAGKKLAYKSETKQLYERLQEASLSLFEFFAVCDSHQDYSITEQELAYGFVQLNLPFFDIWGEIEKIGLRIPFANFLLRFLQTGCLVWAESEMTIDGFAAAIKKLGNLSESFAKLSENGVITFKSLKLAHQRYKLDIPGESLQSVYLLLRKQGKEVYFKEFASVLQANRQVELVHHAFMSIAHIKGREYPEHMTLDQLKNFLLKKGVAFQEVAIVVNSFDKREITSKEMEQKVQDYSNLKNLKDQLSSEKIVQFCHALIQTLKGQPNNFSKIYTQHGLGSINQIKYEDLFNFINYLELQCTPELLKTIFSQIDTEKRQFVKSIEIESYLRRSQSQARVKTLDHTKKVQVTELLRKSIKDVLGAFRAKSIKYSQILDIIALGEFVSQFVTINEQQLQLLFECIQDTAQIQKPTWGDFAQYLLEDPQKSARVFFKECLELFQDTIRRLNIRAATSVGYLGSRVCIQDFVNLMLSLSYNPVKLRLNFKHIKNIFSQHGGEDMGDLEFLMLMTEQEPIKFSTGILELLLSLFKFTLKHSLSKQQLYSVLNLNKSGWLSREELVQGIQLIQPEAQLTAIRALAQHLAPDEALINVAQLCKLIFIGGSLNDNSIEIQAFFSRHYNENLAHELVQLEQLGSGYDGLVQQITISVQDFFKLIPKHQEQDIALLIKAFGLRHDQLDLERIYETLFQVSKDQETQAELPNKPQQEPEQLEQSVVLKFMDQPIRAASTSIQIYENEIIQHICAILNQNQMSLMKSVFQERGHLTLQEFQVLLANIGVPLSQEQTRALVKLIDARSDGSILHYTELLAQIENQGYQILKDDVQAFSVRNQLLQRFCQLEFGDSNYSDQMTVEEFYRLITNEGEQHPFDDAEFQRLANLFSQNGRIQKSLLLRMMGTKKQKFIDENSITKEQLRNIFYRFNGFELVLQQIRALRELFNSNLQDIKLREDSGLTQLALQIHTTRLYDRTADILQYLQNDIRLIQTAVFTLLNNAFQTTYITPHLSVRSERTKMAQLQLSLSGVFLQQVPETQFVPREVPLIEGRQCYDILGKIAASNEPVRVTVWTVPILQTICYDGIILKQHIFEELRFQHVLKQACKLVGVLEKKTNMGTEIHAFVSDRGKQLSQVCKDMGGLLKIPQLVLSGQMIYVAKLWLNDILEIACEVQNYGYSIPLLRSEILYIDGEGIKLGTLNGIQAINLNKFAQGIDVKLIVETVNKTTMQQLALAPEFYSRPIQEITSAADTWAFGVLIFEILFGSKPQIISDSGQIKNDKLFQLIEPSDFESGDLLQREVFLHLRQQLSDIINMENFKLTQQIQLQLHEKSLGSFIKNLYKSVNTDEGMLNQLSQLIDLMCICLQYDPLQRPTLQAIQKSGLLQTDFLNAQLISKPIINYRNPRIIFAQQIYQPARRIALDLIQKKPVNVETVQSIMARFVETIQCSILDEQRLDLISYLFHSRVLDVLNFVILHVNQRQESPALILAFTQVFIELQKHLCSQDSPASQHVEAIVTTLVKFTLGEPYRLISDCLFMPQEEGFFGKHQDETDKYFKEKSSSFSLWTPLIYKIAGPIYKDMISESGVGSGNMVAIRNYIQLCTEKYISPFDMNKFGINLIPVRYNTIARTAEYYSEVISISDAQLQIANYLSGQFSKSSLKISLNYLSALIKSNKFSKLQVLVDSRIANFLIQLIADNDFAKLVLPIFVSLSQAFQNEVPQSLKIMHSSGGMVQQYQQNNAVHLLRNLSIITHILNNSKNRLSNERFLSFQPTEQNQQDQSKTQKLNLFVAEQIFALPSTYQGLFVAAKQDPELIFKIVSNLLQWPKVGHFALGGVTQQLLLEMFRPLALQAEHKKSPYYEHSLQLYEEIVNMALPNAIELIHQSKVRILLQSHSLKVPDKSSPARFFRETKEMMNEWNAIKEATVSTIRDQVTFQLSSKVKRKPAEIPFFSRVKLMLKQVQAFIVYTSKDLLQHEPQDRTFIRTTLNLIQDLFQNLMIFGQMHDECCDLLHSLCDFIMYITLISPLLIFEVEDMVHTRKVIEWMKEVVDFVYEFHIEWDRVNEERIRKIEELEKAKQEEYEKNQKYIESLKPTKNVSFMLPNDTGPQKAIQDSALHSGPQSIQHSRISHSQVGELAESKITTKSMVQQPQASQLAGAQNTNSSRAQGAASQKQLQQSQAPSMPQSQAQSKMVKNNSQSQKLKQPKLQESQMSQSKVPMEYAMRLELRPYSQNKLIQCALSFLKCFTAIIDSNIQQYLQLLTYINFGTWFTNLTYKMWIIFERVIGPSFEETLIIKNQVDESMVRTSLFEAIAKCQSIGLQEQLINAGFIKGIFSYLLSNYKSFEIQKILKSHAYVPFIHWMPYRHEALIYFTAIIWERKNCVNFYNEMMIETHARNTLSEESCHITSKIDNQSKDLNSTVMFTRVYMLCLLISASDSGLLFLMRQLKINQKLMQLFQANEDFRQLFAGIYQYLAASEIEV